MRKIDTIWRVEAVYEIFLDDLQIKSGNSKHQKIILRPGFISNLKMYHQEKFKIPDAAAAREKI